MKKALLIAIGFIPFIIGYLMQLGMMTVFYYTNLPYGLIGIVMLVLWCLITCFFCRYAENNVGAVILINLPALVVLILNAVQLLVFKQYWSNILGFASQVFYLPLLNISFSLTSLWSHTMLPVIIVAFILMVAASVLGCYIYKRRLPV